MNYLLIGPEEYLKSEFLEKLKKSALGASSANLNFETFAAGESSITKIFAFLKTLPFASKSRLALVKDIEKFTQKEKDSILQYLRSPAASATLVLETSSKNFNKFLQEASGLARLIKCDRPREKSLDDWIRKEFAARGKKISPRLAALIRESAAGDLTSLKNEIEKISSFAGARGEIREEHIEAVLGRASYKTAFDLVNLVLGKKTGEAFVLAEGLLAVEKPNQLLNLLAWQFRNFLKMKNLPEGSSPAEISRAVNVNPKFLGKTLEAAKHFSRDDLEKNLKIILEADLFIKRGKLKPRLALESALVKLCR